MKIPEIGRNALSELTTSQMIEVDRAMIEDYGITLTQMMENAGRALAILTRDRFLGGMPDGKHVTVLAGSGGNGGGALVAARRLASWGCKVTVCLTKGVETFKGIPAHQLKILQAMNVLLCVSEPETSNADVILDGIIGYSLHGAPTGVAGQLIRWANSHSIPVLSLDTPSGLDANSGKAFDPSITAEATLTLALPKQGLTHSQIGDLYLADISVPPSLYERFLGLSLGPIFSKGDILRIV